MTVVYPRYCTPHALAVASRAHDTPYYQGAQTDPPVPAAQGPVGQKATITFGNLADIGKALRAAQKARREDLEQQVEAFQPPMLDF